MSPAPNHVGRPYKSKDPERLSQPPPQGQETALAPPHLGRGGSGTEAGWALALLPLHPSSECLPHPSGLALPLK